MTMLFFYFHLNLFKILNKLKTLRIIKINSIFKQRKKKQVLNEFQFNLNLI